MNSSKTITMIGSFKSHAPLRYIVTICALLILSTGFKVDSAQSQPLPIDARVVHIINYQAGIVKAQWIPYGRRWAIQGTTMKVENEILAVVGDIDTRGKGRENACWTSPPDVYTDVFRLVFEPLEIGRRYDVNLDFYGAFDVNLLTPALDRAYQSTVNMAQETYPYIQQQSVREIFAQQVEQELASIFDNEDVILLRNLRNGDCEIVENQTQSVPLINFDSEILTDLSEVVLTEIRTSKRSNRLQEIGTQNRQLVSSQSFSELTNRLKEEELRDYGFLEFGDADLLRNSINDNSIPSEEVVARLYATGFACRTDDTFPEEQCDLLNNIVDRSYEYIREVDVASNGEEDYKPVRRRMLNELGELLSELYTPVANTRINAMQWTDAHSTSDRVRIGTSVGFGVAALNLTPKQFSSFDIDQAESFVVAALKFYPFAVDKQLPSPYFGRELFARTSLVAGLLIKRNLDFEGQKLNSVAAGLYPVLGGGFDITKNITLQAGAVFFRQPGLPPNQNSSEFKAAPMVSFAFDFDGINRLRDAFRNRGSDPYPQP
ncbi:MAG: hypothetical protein KTR29_19800 [Rhodothermaceae bacterium]|nr:hypothetical protein [Rhodothermaceae bacterium]